MIPILVVQKVDNVISHDSMNELLSFLELNIPLFN